MPPTRREVLAGMAAFAITPRGLLNAVDDPLDGNIADYQAGRARGKWTAVGVTEHAIARCRSKGAAWHAIDALADSALDEARASDQRLRAKKLLSRLDGVPVFAKAIYDMRGLPTTGSNAEWARLYPEPMQRDAAEIIRMRAAGAVVLGKTAADDFAYRGSGTSTYTGQVLNPHDASVTRTPGGSSAGSAVSVLGGLAFAALGTDDGGSNRIPAQFSGVVGMKPTFGIVPRDGVIPTWPYLDTHGPLARYVADAAALLSVMAGIDMPALRSNALKGVKLGVVEAHVPRDRMTAEAIATWDRVLADLRAAGANVQTFASPIDRTNWRAKFNDFAKARGDVAPNARPVSSTAHALFQYFSGRSNNPREDIRRGYAEYQKYYDVLPKTFEECEPLFDVASDAAGESFARSRAEANAQLGAAMRSATVSAMIYPTMPFSAFKVADGWPNVNTPLGFGNGLGLPEVSVPAGYQADGLPALSLSVVGLPGTDAQVLSYAHAYENKSRRFISA